jgi:hypothetical protein
MDNLIKLQEEIKLNICQLKAYVFDLEQSFSADSDAARDVKTKLALLEKEMDYFIQYNDLDVSNAVLVEWLEKYKEITDRLLSTSKDLVLEA